MYFIPYKSNETLEHKYYQIPQELFVNEKYKNKLNSDSKILYAFLLDRLSLSQKNHWIDEDNNVYLIFTREEVQEKLNLSDKTVTKSFKILMEVNLVQEKRQRLGKPNLIYVGKINHSDSENLRFLNRKNYDSGIGESTTLDSENLRGINTNNIDTNNINTDTINPKSDEELLFIKEKCNLNEFTKEERTILEDVIDNLYYIDNLKVGNITVNHFKILDKLNLITKDNLVQLLDILKNTPNIQNVKNYLMICLYNNLGNISINKMIKKADTIKPNEREYPAGSLDFLYANFDTLDDTI
jgi:replication initiator protein A (repA) N-terminus